MFGVRFFVSSVKCFWFGVLFLVFGFGVKNFKFGAIFLCLVQYFPWFGKLFLRFCVFFSKCLVYFISYIGNFIICWICVSQVCCKMFKSTCWAERAFVFLINLNNGWSRSSYTVLLQERIYSQGHFVCTSCQRW